MKNPYKTNKPDNGQTEHDYEAHRKNPAPAPEAVHERDDKPASRLIWVVIIAAIIIAGVFYLFFVR